MAHYNCTGASWCALTFRAKFDTLQKVFRVDCLFDIEHLRVTQRSMRHEISSHQRATNFQSLSSLYAMRHTSLGITGIIAFVALGTKAVVAQVPPSLRVGFVATGNSRDSVAASTERGVRLGAEEARRTANLFGGDVLLFAENSAGNPERAASRLLAASKVQVLVGS